MTVDPRELVVGLERVISLVRSLSPAGDVSMTTAATLTRLAAGGPCRLTELAAAERVTQPAMTQLVSRLERDGFAQRHGHPTDGRLVMVHITPAGRRLLARRRAARAKRLSALLNRLDDQEQAAIVAALPALHRLADLASPG
jgi:DNA-binding MarR family transcriptional regulator